MEAVIDQILLLKPFLIVSAAGTILLLITLLVTGRKFDWNKRSTRVIGFFYGANLMDSVVLAVCLLKFFLVISLFFNNGYIYLIDILLYGILVLVYSILRRSVKEALVSVFNGVVIMGIMYMTNFLISYLDQIIFDGKIVAAIFLLAIFLVFYSLFDVAWSVYNIVNIRPEKPRKTERYK